MLQSSVHHFPMSDTSTYHFAVALLEEAVQLPGDIEQNGAGHSRVSRSQELLAIFDDKLRIIVG